MDIQKILTAVVDFFNHPFFVVGGGIATLVTISGFIYILYLVFSGIIPVWYRLGLGLSKRRIALFATTGRDPLNDLLVESKIFSSKNIVHIHPENVSLAEGATIYLVYWKDFKNHLDNVIRHKKYSTAMIVYSPHKDGDIDKETLGRINNEPNSSVVRFRGRLLNDILTSIITTSYEQR